MDNRAIGVFDSGLGGLTAVRELRRILPNEDIVYFGDTGRIPYGTRGRETIIKYAKQDIAFLKDQNVKYILAACGTVSSTLPLQDAQSFGVPYYGVVAAAAKAAVAATKTGRIGILGTPATILSGSYASAVQELLPRAQITATSCPLFVPLVENGYFNKHNPVALLVAQDYLSCAKNANVDTLILGCTHFPLLSNIISEVMGENVTLIDPARETVVHLKEELTAKNILNQSKKQGEVSYYVSDSPDGFYQLAKDFLGEFAGGICKQISVDNYEVK